MIIDAKTIVITLVIVGVASYFGLQLIRSFALSIAQENHDANLAIDMTEEARRAKRERDADAAASAAFAKVEPLLPARVVTKGTKHSQGSGAGSLAKKKNISQPSAAPSSGGLPLAVKSGTVKKLAPSSGGDLNTEVSESETHDDVSVEADEEAPVDEEEVAENAER